VSNIAVEHKSKTELVVVLHGLRGSQYVMRNLVAAAGLARPRADILCVHLPYGGRLGMLAIRPAERIAADVVERIDEAIKQHPGTYESIILVGHSFGAVIARKVAIIAHGEHPGAPFEPLLKGFRAPRMWARQIERIVMLGGMSRGWAPGAARNWMTAAFWTLGSWWAELLALLSFGRARMTLAGIRQGAPFIVQTRLQWLELTRSNVAAPMLVIQLLGGSDDLVAPDDAVDFACDLQGDLSAPFALIEVPFATHDDVYRMMQPSPAQQTQLIEAVHAGTLSDVCKHLGLVDQAKWHIFQRALTDSLHKLANIRITPAHMTDMPALHSDLLATDVVFVIHGIRDRGFWTQKIARVIKQEVTRVNRGRSPDQHLHFRSFTGSYGYFALVPFVLPWIRRWKVEWLMDHYVEVRARCPRARISFVGHSNGTYLLAGALKEYAAVRFERVVLAGSVIRRDFNWRMRLDLQPGFAQPQVKQILNYVATADWVVAIFSKAFQPLVLFDLGSAGHDGFDQCKGATGQNLAEVHYIRGQHSAALVETQWDDIARFIVLGAPVPGPPDQDIKNGRNRLLVVASWGASLILVIIIWFVIGLGVALAKSIYGSGEVSLLASVWQWDGFACTSVVPVDDVCRVVGPVGRGLLSAFNWIAAAFQGRISVPFHAAQSGLSDSWTGLRAGACALYWWAVYIVATRF